MPCFVDAGYLRHLFDACRINMASSFVVGRCVTFATMLTGHISILKGIGYVIAQIVGSALASCLTVRSWGLSAANHRFYYLGGPPVYSLLCRAPWPSHEYMNAIEYGNAPAPLSLQTRGVHELCAGPLSYASAGICAVTGAGVKPAAHCAQVALRGGAGYYLGMGDDAPGALSELHNMLNIVPGGSHNQFRLWRTAISLTCLHSGRERV